MPPVAQAPGSSAARQVERAKQLERDRDKLMKQIAANRTYLRLMAQNDELTNDQEDWLEDFYPTKEKGEQRSAEEIEATRRAKAAARDGN
jgi:hypothetical protein